MVAKTQLALPDVIKASDIDTARTKESKGYIVLKMTTKHPLSFYSKEDYSLQADGSWLNQTLSETISLQNRDREQNQPKTTPTYERRQVRRQVGDNLGDNPRGYGELSRAFDAFMEANREEHYKRDVAEILGTTYRDKGFQKLLLRRRVDGVIKVSRGGDKIRWVNKDWKLNRIDKEAKSQAYLDILLPFGAEKYIKVPQHSEIVLAGDIGSGKTHWGYELANLNVGKLPIRHFFNEMGDAKAGLLLEDYPKLEKALENGYELINLNKETLYVADNLDPDGLNIYDYLHLPASKEWFLFLGKELANLSQQIDTGAIVVMLQKKRGQPLAMGGDTTRQQCEIYFTLNIQEDVIGGDNEHGYKRGQIEIIKCKDWATDRNPEMLCIAYRTAPLHGKLVARDDDWVVKQKE